MRGDSRRRRRETRLEGCSGRRTRGRGDGSRPASTRLKMRETLIEISPRRLHWGRLNQRLAMSCLIRGSLTRRVALAQALQTMKTTTYMINLSSRTGLQQASTRISSERPAKAPWLTSLATTMATMPRLMSSRCSDKRHNVDSKAALMPKEGPPQLRQSKESQPARSQLSSRGVPWVKMQPLAKVASSNPQRELVTPEMPFLTSILFNKKSNKIN